MTKRKPVPLFFVVLSLLYLIYAVTMEDSRMIGDEVGGDPGGKLLPLALAIFMIVASLYLFLTDTVKGAPRKMGKPERSLFILTLALTIAYVLFNRSLGFILSTCCLLFCLCFANSRGGLRRDELKLGGLWLLLTLLFQVGLYSLGRYITRSLMFAGRSGAAPEWVGNIGFTAFVTTAALAGICILLIFASRKPLSAEKAGAAVHDAWVSALVAVISTQLLFIVFRQLFFVGLTSGLIFW